MPATATWTRMDGDRRRAPRRKERDGRGEREAAGGRETRRKRGRGARELLAWTVSEVKIARAVN